MRILVSVIRNSEPGIKVIDSRSFDVSLRWERFRAYKLVAWNLLAGHQIVLLPVAELTAFVTQPSKEVTLFVVGSR